MDKVLTSTLPDAVFGRLDYLERLAGAGDEPAASPRAVHGVAAQSPQAPTGDDLTPTGACVRSPGTSTGRVIE